MLCKTISSGSDPLVSILAYRNTRITGVPKQSSPGIDGKKDQNLATNEGRPVGARRMGIPPRNGHQRKQALEYNRSTKAGTAVGIQPLERHQKE